MVKVVTGSESFHLIKKLRDSLASKTVSQVKELDNISELSYSPWLCARPLLTSRLPNEILSIDDNSRGRLIKNVSELDEISHFLNGQGYWMLEGLPSTPDTWQIMTNIESARPDAVESFDQALEILSRSPFLYEAYKTVVDCVVPLEKNRPSGFDSNYLRGATFRAFPSGCTPEGVAFELAHATGHQVALLLSSKDVLFTSGREEVIYYKARNDRREAIDAFYSVVALGYMTILFKELPRASEIAKSDPYLRSFNRDLPPALIDGVQSIRDSTKLTALGNAVLSELEQIAA